MSFEKQEEIKQKSSDHKNIVRFGDVQSNPITFLSALGDNDTSDNEQSTAISKEKGVYKERSQQEITQIYNQIGQLPKNNVSRSEQDWEISEHMQGRLRENGLKPNSQYYIKKIPGYDNSVIVERTQAGELKDISGTELGKSLNTCFDNRFPDNKLNHTERYPNIFLVTADTPPIVKDSQNVPKQPKKPLW